MPPVGLIAPAHQQPTAVVRPRQAGYRRAEIREYFPGCAVIDIHGHEASSGLVPGDEREGVAAGTLVVWDVDVLKDNVVRVYRAGCPTEPTVYRVGELGEAEPAVPRWSIPVADLFPPG